MVNIDSYLRYINVIYVTCWLLISTKLLTKSCNRNHLPHFYLSPANFLTFLTISATETTKQLEHSNKYTTLKKLEKNSVDEVTKRVSYPASGGGAPFHLHWESMLFIWYYMYNIKRLGWKDSSKITLHG